MVLKPLRWQAQEDVIFDDEARAFHRAGCEELMMVPDPNPDLRAEAGRRRRPRTVAAGAWVELVRAPAICARCRPDVMLALGEENPTNGAIPASTD